MMKILLLFATILISSFTYSEHQMSGLYQGYSPDMLLSSAVLEIDQYGNGFFAVSYKDDFSEHGVFSVSLEGKKSENGFFVETTLSKNERRPLKHTLILVPSDKQYIHATSIMLTETDRPFITVQLKLEKVKKNLLNQNLYDFAKPIYNKRLNRTP